MAFPRPLDWAGALLASLLLAACTQGNGVPSSGASSIRVPMPSLEGGRTIPESEPDYLAVSRAMKKLATQARGACRTQQEGASVLLPNSATDSNPTCFHERILAAFWQEPGAGVCLAHQSEEAFLSCVVSGSYLSMVLRNVAKSHGLAPPALGPREWLDPAAGQQATSEYINTWNSFLCRYGGYARRAKCRYELRLQIFGISEEESELCEDLDEPEACQMTTSMVLFIRRAIPLAS